MTISDDFPMITRSNLHFSLAMAQATDEMRRQES